MYDSQGTRPGGASKGKQLTGFKRVLVKLNKKLVIKECTMAPEGASKGKQQTSFKGVLVKVNRKPVLKECTILRGPGGASKDKQ